VNGRHRFAVQFNVQRQVFNRNGAHVPLQVPR
jgi:hypothetical protein